MSRDDRLQIYNNAAMKVGNPAGGWGLGSPQSEPYNGPTVTNARISDYWNKVDRYGTGDPSITDYAGYAAGRVKDGYNYLDDKARRFGSAQDEALKKDGSFSNVRSSDGFGFNMETAGYLTGAAQRTLAPLLSMAGANKGLGIPPSAPLVPGGSKPALEDEEYLERYYGIPRRKKRRLY
ncbi:hypothetical protein [Geobacter sp. DSM 9736]|uniref:hypothetical protein n=1 Tax=Geobacter sp. DSM 9736 TaxID=1277350 RepID=UPI0012FD9B41|nr:hypothetical protein [Geobacter sp. DSM 9736]